jgi:hypothetical protein
LARSRVADPLTVIPEQWRIPEQVAQVRDPNQLCRARSSPRERDPDSVERKKSRFQQAFEPGG